MQHEPKPFERSKRNPLPPDWKKKRAAAMKRDKGRCRYCGAKATAVDHAIGRADGGTDELSNLLSTCDACHKVKTQEEAQRGRIRNRRERYR